MSWNLAGFGPRCWERACARDARGSLAVHRLAELVRRQRSNYAAAVECFRPLTRLRDRDPAAHTSLGAACQMLGDLETARRCYERAVSLAPDYPESDERQRKWVSPDQAALMVQEPGLRDILLAFSAAQHAA